MLKVLGVLVFLPAAPWRCRARWSSAAS